MESIKPTSDRKVRFYSTQKNSFGLLPGDPKSGGTCPGCTQAEGGCWYLAKGRKTHTCYVDGLMGAYKGVRAILQHNTDILTREPSINQAFMLRTEFQRFRDAELKRAARTHSDAYLRYRIHWSGDIFNRGYAWAIANAVSAFPDITFWTYTRSFEYLNELECVPNLVTYLSLDKVNHDAGMAAYAVGSRANNPNIQIAYMAKTNDLSTAPCPVDLGKLGLEEGCANCRRCIQPHSGSTGAVWFKS